MCITCVPIDDTCSSVKTSVYTDIPVREQSRGQGQSPELVPATEGTSPAAQASSSLDQFCNNMQQAPQTSGGRVFSPVGGGENEAARIHSPRLPRE